MSLRDLKMVRRNWKIGTVVDHVGVVLAQENGIVDALALNGVSANLIDEVFREYEIDIHEYEQVIFLT